MDTSELRELLHGYLAELDWGGGVTKDDIMAHLAGRDDTLRTMLNEYMAEGMYATLDDVLNIIPSQAWQNAQGLEWRGPDTLLPEDVPSNFGTGAAVGDTSDVYHAGGSIPRTPGFGEARGTTAVGEAGSNAGEVDPGIAGSGEIAGEAIG
jgi:hypothetical protein